MHFIFLPIIQFKVFCSLGRGNLDTARIPNAVIVHSPGTWRKSIVNWCVEWLNELQKGDLL